MDKSLSNSNYAVVETKDKSGSYVQFVPMLWLKSQLNSKIENRATAKCSFPVRMPGQTIDQHLKFVKNAKFLCTEPNTTEKWELLECRVLKIGIGRKSFLCGRGYVYVSFKLTCAV